MTRMQQQMKRAVLGFAVLAMAVLAAPAAMAQDSGALKVTVRYTGPGTVDATHELYIWVFDTPVIDENSVPLAADVLTRNGATASFTGLPKQVYLVAAFDERGDYDGSAAPPSGTPITLYGANGVADPVPTGDDAAVTVTFDDTVRMP